MQKNLTVILELRNTLSEIKKSVAGFYSQLNTAKQRISRPEISQKTSKLKQKEKINMRMLESNSQWDYSWKENEEDAVFSEKSEEHSKPDIIHYSMTQEYSQGYTGKCERKSHLAVKLLKIKDNNKILKTARHITF